jgi:hypothetical protein
MPRPLNSVVGVAGGNNTVNLTGSQLLKTGEGSVIGIFVASSSSGTIKLWDSTAASGAVVVNTFSAVAATWYPLPFYFYNGLYITIAGTIDCSVSFN